MSKGIVNYHNSKRMSFQNNSQELPSTFSCHFQGETILEQYFLLLAVLITEKVFRLRFECDNKLTKCPNCVVFSLRSLSLQMRGYQNTI